MNKLYQVKLLGLTSEDDIRKYFFSRENAQKFIDNYEEKDYYKVSRVREVQVEDFKELPDG